MTAHHLLPADMRRLPSPWNDLTWERKPALDELPHTEATERAALDALAAALSGSSAPPVPRVWSDESWELFDRIRHEAGYRLDQVMPTADRFTREGIADVLREWAGAARLPVPSWWLEDQLDLIVGVLTDQVLQGWAHDVLRWLQQKPYDEAGVAAAAERCVENGLASQDAVNLLHALGTPHGEQALLRVVQDAGASENSRAQARDALLWLRRPGYDARARQPAQGEHPLLPPAVRELPYSWGAGFQWPVELPESDENIARARAILLACAPSEPVNEPVPAPSWHGYEDEEPPAWLEVRQVMRELMPYARLVTEERMTEATRECALLGIPGVPPDPNSEEAAHFVRRWTTWISGWIAGEVFTWLGMYVDDDTLVTSWAMELAERYARFGFVPEQAVAMLRGHDTVPRSREALARLAAEPTPSPPSPEPPPPPPTPS
ncbi:hypothetical protein [Streptomyces xylophagus]|uniref:hypothetical protein n=1 Tax=Streptomyces xylophagus TaxID=285514 RepID=UPI0005B9E26D|nr:hypothetical protein [Streptomyces xylophagus]